MRALNAECRLLIQLVLNENIHHLPVFAYIDIIISNSY